MEPEKTSHERTKLQPATSLTLWGCATTRTFRPHWMLAELGLDYEKKLIGPRTGETSTEEYSRLNPRQKIPLLQDGDLVLAESAAITSYLGSTYGVDRHLEPPADSRRRALYDQWCFFIMTELDAHTLYVLRKHRDLAALYGEAPAACKAAEEGFDKQIRVAAAELEWQPYLVGERFTGADILLGSCLDWAEHYELSIPSELSEYHCRLRERPAYQRAFEINYRSRPDLAMTVCPLTRGLS